jgi:hypothetical protein
MKYHTSSRQYRFDGASWGVDGTSIRDKSKCLVLLGKNETGFA